MKKIPVMPQPERKKEPMPLHIKIIMLVISVVALLLVILTFVDMAGYHLLMPEIIPMGCISELLLLMVWLAMVIYRRRRTEHAKRVSMLVSAIVIMLVGLLLSSTILQYVQIVLPMKYGVIESPSGQKVAILSVLDNGFGSNEETLAMLSRMEERQRHIDAAAAGTEPAALPEVPSSVVVDENGAIIYDENGVLSYSLDAYDYESYGYIYSAYPVKLGIFYNSNALTEGLIYRGVESESKLLYEWLDDDTLSLYLENPQPGDSGKVTLAN